jgi:nitrogen fixation protein FixH
MKVESLQQLEAAFDGWRSRKRHEREAVPSDLRERARRAIDVHGLGAVARATKLERTRLRAGPGSQGESTARGACVPSFSRVELAAPGGRTQPFAEVEMPTGLKLRIFAQTEQTLGLVASLLGMGGAR